MSGGRGRPSDWAARHAASDAAARAIIDEESAARDAKTAKLKALREGRSELWKADLAGTRERAKSIRPTS